MSSIYVGELPMVHRCFSLNFLYVGGLVIHGTLVLYKFLRWRASYQRWIIFGSKFLAAINCDQS